MPVLGASTPAGAAAVPPGWYNVKDYGAVGDNVTDDATAIQAAMNALKATINSVTASHGGQVLYFPPGYYRINSALDFTVLSQVRIIGGAGRGIWRSPDDNPPTVIVYYGAGSSPAVDMRGSQGCIWDGVSLLCRGSSFTGDLLSWDSITQGDIFGHRIQNCTLDTVTGTPASLLSMAGNIEVSADNVHFKSSGTTQVRMVNPSAPSQWSNANSFRSCSFTGTRTNSILNPGPHTTLMDCTFEPTAGGVAAPILVNALGNEQCTGITIVGCGFWDNTSGTSPWLKSTVATSAFAIVGGKWTVQGGPVISLSSHTGLSLIGVRFDNAGGGTPNVFDPDYTITDGSMLGCYVSSPVVDNHDSVFV